MAELVSTRLDSSARESRASPSTAVSLVRRSQTPCATHAAAIGCGRSRTPDRPPLPSPFGAFRIPARSTPYHSVNTTMERPRTMSKAASMSAVEFGAEKHRSSSLFSKWRSRSSLRRDTAGDSAVPQHVGLDGKELRDAVWREQRQRESVTHAPVRPMRVIRYAPPRHHRSPSASADEADEDDDDAFSNPDSARDMHHPMTYDGVPDDHGRLGSSRVKHDDPNDMRASRLSLTFSRLSFSSSARNSLAEYKAKKYDVAWKKDDDVPDCQVCHLAFTKWSRRRHHCRVCGDIICDECSPDQVHIAGRFTRAKRSCAACFALLEAMMHLGDPHVKMVVEKEPGSRDWVDKTPSPTREHTVSNIYHDRLAEIQRVTAAGTKARRARDIRQCVVHAPWLRAWLAFTRHNADADSGDEFSPTKTRTESTQSLGSSMGEGESPPGPIDNLSLLMMRQGQLVPRDNLVRIDNPDLAASESRRNQGDYQIIPLEVWDVLSRYYGGGPRIEIVPSSIVGEPDKWVVAVAAVVRSARAQKTNPQAPRSATAPPLTVEEKVLERALMERHDPFCILLDMPAMSNRPIYDPQASASSSTTSTPAYQRSASDARAAASSSNTSSSARRSPINSQAPPKRESSSDRPPPPPPQSNTQRPPTSTSASSTRRPKPEPEREPTKPTDHRRSAQAPRNEPGRRRNGSTASSSSRRESAAKEPTAASAASAFALAMKQARLKQQRAIAGGRSARSTVE